MGEERSSRETMGRSLLLRFGQALHEAGAPAHRIEEAMASLAGRLGVEGRFFTTPTSIFVGFGPPVSAETAVLRVEPAGVNLGRMSLLDAALEEVESGRLDAERAVERVEAIAAARSPYPEPLFVACFGVSAAAVAVFLGGGVRELVAAAAIGLQTGLLALVAGRAAAWSRVFEWVASPAAALAALGWALAIGPLVPEVASLAGLIVLVPGLGLTVATIELASRHLVSGVARLAGAGIAFLAIGFGLALGKRLEPAIGSASAAGASPLPAWATVAALLVAPLALTVLFRARQRDAGVILLTGALAYLVARGVTGVAGSDVGVLAAAFVLGLSGNLYTRAFRKPSAVPVVPGILMLVPGSLGVRSIGSLFQRQALSGVEFAFGMIALAVALVAGLLFANLVLPPRRAL